MPFDNLPVSILQPHIPNTTTDTLAAILADEQWCGDWVGLPKAEADRFEDMLGAIVGDDGEWAEAQPLRVNAPAWRFTGSAPDSMLRNTSLDFAARLRRQFCPPATPTLWVDDDAWREGSLPPRPWLAGGYLLRGAVTVLSGPGGVSKSTLAAAWATAVALGQSFHRFDPVQPGKVLLLNAEDDAGEQRRRLSATLRQFGRVPADLAGKVVRVGPHGVGTLFDCNARTGEITATTAMHQLEKLIEQRKPDLIVLDPLVELHTAEENNNTVLRAVVARFRVLAIQHNAAVLIVHHARKGAGASPGDPDTSRGASSIVGAARVVLTVTGMQPEEAAKLGMPADQARHYCRVDGAKSNYATLTEAEWFERVAYQLDNGDSVAALVPWTPPEDAAPGEVVEAIKRGIAAGCPDGRPWAAKLSKDLRSVRNLFVTHGVATMNGQARLLADLMGKHGVTVGTFRDRGQRYTPRGLRTAEGLPHAEWIEDDAGAAETN